MEQEEYEISQMPEFSSTPQMNASSYSQQPSDLNSLTNMLMREISNIFSQGNHHHSSDNSNNNSQFIPITARIYTISPSGISVVNSTQHNGNMNSILDLLFNTFRIGDPSDVALPLTQDSLNKLEEKKYHELANKDPNDECTICKEKYESDSSVIVLPCKHVFHKECITQWLTNYHHKCPLCRQPCGDHTALL